jgi:serine/threonine protein kinase
LEVALKTLKAGSEGMDKVKFLQEAAIMAQFKHPNIVVLYGVVSDKEPVSGINAIIRFLSLVINSVLALNNY